MPFNHEIQDRYGRYGPKGRNHDRRKPCPADRIGLDFIVIEGQEYNLLTVVLAYTAASNLTGMPAISISVGFSKDGLPIGLQVIAPHFEESRALRVAGVLEEALTDVRQRKPELGGL